MEVEARLFGCLGRRFPLTDERHFYETRELARHSGRSARTVGLATPPTAVAGRVHPRWAHV